MKKAVLAVFVCMTLGRSQDESSCCELTATEEFSAFGKDVAFVSLHESPTPLIVIQESGMVGIMKEIPSADTQKARIYEVKAAKPTNKYLFVFQEWWGLNDYIKQESDKLQKELSVNVIALDLYDGKLATDPQTAAKYSGEVKEKRAQAIINAAIAYVGKNANVATLGWCFGGGWSLQSALLLGKQAIGCVIYYGMPEKDVNKLKTLNCDVLGIFGTQDGYITPKVVEEFQKNMKEAKKKLEVRNYDAVHAFANPSNPKHDEEKTKDAHAKTIAFLKAKFGV